MRETGLRRLKEAKLSLNDPSYLFYKPLLSDLRKAILSYAKGDVLDIGCGNKPYLSYFEGHITTYTGCDVVQSDQNCVDIICLANDIPLPDASKDTVFSTQVIEHVADHAGLLAEGYRILKTGGYAIVSGPMYWEHHEAPHDYFRFTRFGFEHIFEQAGFKNIQIIPNGGKWNLTGQMIQNNLRSSMTGKGLGRKLLKGWYWLFRVKWFIHIFFDWLDQRDRDYSTTLNFLVIAQK